MCLILMTFNQMIVTKGFLKSVINISIGSSFGQNQCPIDSPAEWLEDQIRQAIVGQQFAIKSVVAAIQRRYSGWFDDNHPLVFLFLGSSGNA